MLIFLPVVNPPSPPFIKGGIRGGLRAILTRLKSLSIISVTFLLLSSVQLIPFLELFHHSIRGQGILYHEATVWSFAPKDILLFFLPDAYGYFLDMKKYWINQCWFKTLYTGGLPFILSLIFFIFGKHVGEPLCGLHQIGRPQRAAPPISGGRDGERGFGRERTFFLSLIIFSLFLSLGQYNPLYPFVFTYVPFFNGIRYPVKFLYIFIIVLSITAGLGFQRLIEFSKEVAKKKIRNGLIIFSLVAGLFLLFLVINHKGVEQFLKLKGVDFPDFNYLPINLHHAKRFLFYLTLFFLLLRVGYEVKWKAWAKVLLIFFLTADLFGNMGFYGKEKTSEYFKKTKILETISSDEGQFRIFSTARTISLDTPILIADASPLDVFKEKHLPSFNLLYHFHDIWGIDVIRLKRVDDLYKAFINTPSISTTNLVDLYGVKYIISVTPLGDDPRFELIYSRFEGLQGKEEDLIKEDTVKLYKTRNPFPRAWLLKKFEVLQDHAILSRMLTKEFHPGQEVFLEEEPKWEIGMGGHRGPPLQNKIAVGEPLRGLPNKVELILERNNEQRLLVRAKENVLLVLSDTYYPGWKAFVSPVRYDSYHQGNPVDKKLSIGVDGKERKILRANYNFRGISLEAGEYGVKFIYDPISFKIGSLLSLLTLAGIVVYFIGRPRRVAPTK